MGTMLQEDRCMQQWRAKWIWYPKAEYELFLNGERVGHGPMPSAPANVCFDVYDVTSYLKEGENTILIYAHNTGAGLCWHPIGRGGVIAQMETEEKILLCTDEQFYTKRAAWMKQGSPRIMWCCPFAETYCPVTGENSPENVNEDGWVFAVCVGNAMEYPYTSMYERDIPMKEEGVAQASHLVDYTYHLQGLQTVSFAGIEIPEDGGILFAESSFWTEQGMNTHLHFSCDDAVRVFLDGKMVICQEYDDGFVRGQVWNGRIEYEQFHYGIGHRKEINDKIVLEKGEHKIQVIVDVLPDSWGFVLGIADPEAYDFKEGNGDSPSVLLDLDYDKWHVWGYAPTTGLKNSLLGYHSFPEMTGKTYDLEAIVDGYECLEITDYSKLIRSEIRMLQEGRTETLCEGMGVIYDLGHNCFGNPWIELDYTGDTILDVTYTNVLRDDYRPSFMDQLRYADRLYLKKEWEGIHRWKGYLWRENRYIHISVRKGQAVIRKVGSLTCNYPVTLKASFTCDDELYNRMWKVSVDTSRILMQDGYQDCMRREWGTHNTRSFIHASSAAYYCFGDTALIRKNLMDGLRTQEDNGWFNSHGYSDINADEVAEMLWWFQALEGYLIRSADKEFMLQIYEKVKCALRFFGRWENMDCLLDCKNETRKHPGRICYIDDATNRWPNSGEFQGLLLGFNALYYKAMVCFSHIAGWLGKERDEKLYAKKAQVLKESVNKTFWNEEEGAYYNHMMEDGKPGYLADQSLQLTVCFNGLCDGEQKRRTMDNVRRSMLSSDGDFMNTHMTFGFYYFYLHLLFEMGDEEVARRLIEDYYGKWVNMGASTYGEYYELRDFVDRETIHIEYNTHNYGTSLHEHFYSNILGIRPLTFGFKEYEICPHTLNLHHAKGEVFTSRGMVGIEWWVNEDHFRIHVETPDAYRPRIIVPEKYRNAEIYIHNAKEDGQPAKFEEYEK